MKSFFLIFVFLGTSFNAVAAHAWQVQAFVLNPETRLERSQDQDLVQRHPENYALALRVGLISGLMESSKWFESTGNSVLSVKREAQSYLLWGRVHFYDLTLPQTSSSLYFGGGAGSYQETITTRLNSSSTIDKPSQKFETALSGGVDTSFHWFAPMNLIVAAEVRLFFADEFDPNPQAGGVLRFGVEF